MPHTSVNISSPPAYRPHLNPEAFITPRAAPSSASRSRSGSFLSPAVASRNSGVRRRSCAPGITARAQASSGPRERSRSPAELPTNPSSPGCVSTRLYRPVQGVVDGVWLL